MHHLMLALDILSNDSNELSNDSVPVLVGKGNGPCDPVSLSSHTVTSLVVGILSRVTSHHVCSESSPPQTPAGSGMLPSYRIETTSRIATILLWTVVYNFDCISYARDNSSNANLGMEMSARITLCGIKQRRAWLLLGWVAAERSCPCNQPTCPAIGGGSEVTFKPLVPRLRVRESFLALTSTGRFKLQLLRCVPRELDRETNVSHHRIFRPGCSASNLDLTLEPDVKLPGKNQIVPIRQPSSDGKQNMLSRLCDFRTLPMTGQANCLQGQDCSAVTHPSSARCKQQIDMAFSPLLSRWTWWEEFSKQNTGHTTGHPVPQITVQQPNVFVPFLRRVETFKNRANL
ncbi:hypothetical protein J6590_073373 [Homalodisca vitripennis]|nr:hypothetical protein J6590_073373 [Homalodisca vitripennis]